MRFRSFQSQQRSSGASVFKPLGRSDPIVINDGARIYEQGSFTVMTDDESDREDLDAILDDGSALLLQFPPSYGERDRWIAHMDHERTRLVDNPLFSEYDDVVAWQEVARPDEAT